MDTFFKKTLSFPSLIAPVGMFVMSSFTNEHSHFLNTHKQQKKHKATVHLPYELIRLSLFELAIVDML